MIIEIDPKSGFCFGVVNAIDRAEQELSANGKLFCLGDIVHNNVEVDRLKEKGLITITYEEFEKLSNVSVLIRAHGEPPSTYEIAKKNNVKLIDASCTVVLKLQEKVKKGFEMALQNGGQVVIFGKKGHAEVNGLVGQTNNQAIVIGDLDELSMLNFTKPIYLFSQTTQNIYLYNQIIEEIKNRYRRNNLPETFLTFHKTICGQVSSRDKELTNFSARHSMVLFVSGKKSSNGKVLYEVCKKVNQNTYFIEDVNDINKDWFVNIKSVGICGATSTPRWLMEKVAVFLEKFTS